MSTTIEEHARRSGPAERVHLRVEVAGIVQGVGFRPFVYLVASELGLAGSVTNDSVGVVIDIEGPGPAVASLIGRLSTDHPPLARIDHVAVRELELSGITGFAIRESTRESSGHTLVAPDIAICPECRAELSDPANRRFRHPFITCTNCGPRFTIIRDLPYDRPTTTMSAFTMCASCAAEYADPRDRRYYAQTIACSECGPELRLVRPDRMPQRGYAALDDARELLASGGILAVKGIGGYHLMCDAGNELAVAELRARKRRGDKPFAVMVPDLDEAQRHAQIDEREACLLESPARPIVLLRRRSGSAICYSVAPRVPDIGLMLAYTPIQVLLFGLPGDSPGPKALVATSGNLAGESIIADDAAALSRLAPLVDGWLTHNRPIHVPCDDSVLRIVDGEQLPLRRARGYAPLPLPLPLEAAPTLASGADLKNTYCLANGRSAWVSQHIGDIDDISTLDAFEQTEAHMEALTGIVPTHLAVDAHPGYRSSQWGCANAAGRPVRSVQHHHAHVASLLGEHEIAPGTKVIGFAFDGTGYGTDGAVWGGEVLVADYGGFERFSHLKYVALPGGDVSIERPYRMALSHLSSAGVDWDPCLEPVAACSPKEAGVLAKQLRSGFGCVPTSSMGRLFDAVSSLCGVVQTVGYEAQAAIELEGLARNADQSAWDAESYEFELHSTSDDRTAPIEIDAAPVIRAVVEDLRHGITPTDVAVRFHGAVVGAIQALAIRARERFDLDLVGLTGGVFQNPILLARATRSLRKEGFTVLRHRVVPPNDGGLSLGQVLVASCGLSLMGDQPCA